jgi:gamma-glutamylcyclotransferase
MLTFTKFVSENKDDLVEPGNELYFSYGHNANSKAFEKLDPPAKILGRCSLDGYRYVLEQYSDIRPEEGSTVEGVLWTLPKNKEGPLNRYEKYYHRINVNVNYKGKTYKAFAYKMDTKHYGRHKPSKEYLDIVSKGYKENHIPLEQLNTAVKERMEKD